MLPLSITTIQTDLYWEDKPANLGMLEKKMETIPPGAEIVILPEMFSTGFSMQSALLAESMNGNTVRWMKKTASAHKIILTGSVIIEEGGHFFNRLIWMQPDGNYGFYDKRHLFAFASEDESYTAGRKRLITSVKGWKVNLQICYDLRFPVWIRQKSDIHDNPKKEPEYDLIVFVANWPESRKHAWKTLLQARAIENQCYVVGVNRIGKDGKNIYHSGDSMVVDPLGEILYTGSDREEIHTMILHKEKLAEVRSRFPFGKDAEFFSIDP